MTELNLKCHYQMVRAVTKYGTELSVHEAFSTDKGVLYMICPIPVYVIGESEDDISELASMLKQDIKRYPMVDATAIQTALDRYIDYTNAPIDMPDYTDENLIVDDEDAIVDDGYEAREDKILDLVEFMNKNKR